MTAFSIGMKRTLGIAAAGAFALGLAADFGDSAQAREKKTEAAPAQKFSKGVLEAFGAATKAGEKAKIEQELQAANYPAVLARLTAAEQVADRTPSDNYNIAIFKIQVGQKSKDNALLKTGLTDALASGLTPVAQVAVFNEVLGDLANNAKDYVAAQQYYSLVLQAKPNDETVASKIATVAYQNRSVPAQQRFDFFTHAIEAAERSGAKADQSLYGSRLQIAVDNKLTAAIAPAAAALLKAYPSPRNWEAALDFFRVGNRMDEQGELDTYRLQRAAGGLTGEGQYLDYANVAQQRGLPGEAKAILDEGAAKKVIDPGKASYLELRRSTPSGKVAADIASLPSLEKQANAASTGKLSRATADGYLSHANYAKAAALYQQALAKGGENTDTVNTRLGFALAMSGNKAGAQTAFAAVSGEPRKTLAAYWLIWLSQKA